MTAPSRGMTAAALDDLVIPPLDWVVPGLMPEGFGVLAAAPKIGKSWLVLNLGLAAASGDSFLGVHLDQRPVLYLALEDGQRRLQERMRRVLDGRSAPTGLVFEIDQLNALAVATDFSETHSSSRPLIVIDTLACVRPDNGSRRTPGYADDYRFARSLKELADRGGTVLGVHHTRKQDSEDFLETASGTNGLTGAADFVMVLDRKRNEASGDLHITGRDVTESSYSLLFEDGLWRTNGTDLAEAARLSAIPNLGDNMKAVLAHVNMSGTATSASVAGALEMKRETAGTYLRRLAGHGLIDSFGQGEFRSKQLSGCPSEASPQLKAVS